MKHCCSDGMKFEKLANCDLLKYQDRRHKKCHADLKLKESPQFWLWYFYLLKE